MSSILVEFSDAFLCEVANPAVTVHATYPQRGSSTSRAGEVKTYAGGRTRVVTAAGRKATFPLTLQLLTDADVDLLDSWQGRLLLLRDGSGRREFGTVLAGEVTDYYDVDGTLHDVAVVFTRLSYDEAVT